MKRAGFLILITLLWAGILNSAEVFVKVGDVFVERAQQKLEVTKGFKLQENDKIITGASSKAVIRFENNTKAYVGANAEVFLKQLKEKRDNVTMKLLRGKIRSKVTKVKPGGGYRIQTPVATAGVRGTDFVVDVQTEHKVEIVVLEGEVNVMDFATGEEINVSKDFTAKIVNGKVETGKLSLEKREAINKEWSSIIKHDEKMEKTEEKEAKAEAKKEGKKPAAAEPKEPPAVAEVKITEQPAEVEPAEKEDEMLDFDIATDVTEALADIDIDKENIQEGKTAEFQAGRVLKDREGNLVRLDQYFSRPDDNTIHFINVVKRGDELTVIDAQATVDKALPENIADWPDFFDVNDVKVLKTDLRIKDANDEIKVIGQWDDTINDLKLSLFINGKEFYDEPEVKEIYSGLDDNIVKGSYELKLLDLNKQPTGDIITADYWGLDENGNVISKEFIESSAENLDLDAIRNIAGQVDFNSSLFKDGKLSLISGMDIGFSILDKVGFTLLDKIMGKMGESK